MLEYLLGAVDGMLDDWPIYEQGLRDAEDAELFDDDDDYRALLGAGGEPNAREGVGGCSGNEAADAG